MPSSSFAARIHFQAGICTRIVTTLALLPPFFHFSGVANDKFAVRQLYAQATQNDFTLWAGVRMYRGDDIYLLNWWPLDNQNTVAAAAPRMGGTSVALHADAASDLPNQFQQVPSPCRTRSAPPTSPSSIDRAPSRRPKSRTSCAASAARVQATD